MIQQERYTITLCHEYLDTDGKYKSLSEPIQVSYSMINVDTKSLLPVQIINDMMDRLKMCLIERIHCE